jgi:putative FmdB family regulatory protein
MPVYTYRREDGSTFDIRQKFSDAPLTTDPETGQAVTRVIHAAGIVFKGSGFYVNDSKSSKANMTIPATNGASSSENGTGDSAKASDSAKPSEDSKKAAKSSESTSTPASPSNTSTSSDS